MVFHQKYVNEENAPLEIQFMMPISDTFTCQKICVDFTMPDGSTDSFETRVVEKEKAQEKYEDAVASGETAVIATLPPIRTQFRNNMMRMNLGGMPPLATANLRAFCNQKLELEDESYCFRLPMSYVPAYMGNVSKLASPSENDGEAVLEDPDLYESVQSVLEVADMPIKSRASGLWDI